MAEDSNLNNQEEQNVLRAEGGVGDRISQRPEEDRGSQEERIALGNDVLVYLQSLLAQTAFYTLPNQIEGIDKIPSYARHTDWLTNMRIALKYATQNGAEPMYRALWYQDNTLITEGMGVRLNIANELIAMLDYQYRLNELDAELGGYWKKMFSVNGLNAKIESCAKVDDRTELPGDVISTQVTEGLRSVTAKDMDQIRELRSKITQTAAEILKKYQEVVLDWLPALTRKGTTALYRTMCAGVNPKDHDQLLEIIEQRRSLVARMGKRQWPGIKYSMEFEREFNQLYQEYQKTATQCHYLEHLDGMAQITKGLISVVEQQEQKLIELQEAIPDQQPNPSGGGGEIDVT